MSSIITFSYHKAISLLANMITFGFLDGMTNGRFHVLRVRSTKDLSSFSLGLGGSHER